MEKVFLFEANSVHPDGTYRIQFYAINDMRVVADVVKIRNGEVKEVCMYKVVTNVAGDVIHVPRIVLFETMRQAGYSIRRMTNCAPKVKLFGKICLNGLMSKISPRRTVFRKLA